MQCTSAGLFPVTPLEISPRLLTNHASVKNVGQVQILLASMIGIFMKLFKL